VYLTPSFPSLYNPSLSSTIKQQGYFLHSSGGEYCAAYLDIAWYRVSDITAIWRFTFYWTLIFVMATFMACAALASFNLLLSRMYRRKYARDACRGAGNEGDRSGTQASGASGDVGTDASASTTTPTRPTPTVGPTAPTVVATSQSAPLSRYAQRKRPPLYFIAFIPLGMAAAAALVAIVSGTVTGFALAAVYSAAGFSMST
jgi:hypothetical protein